MPHIRPNIHREPSKCCTGFRLSTCDDQYHGHTNHKRFDEVSDWTDEDTAGRTGELDVKGDGCHQALCYSLCAAEVLLGLSGPPLHMLRHKFDGTVMCQTSQMYREFLHKHFQMLGLATR